MVNVIVIGGGWAGCAAAVAAARVDGIRAILLERTDMLLGTGLAGGIFRNNGRYTAAEEGLAMGIELFEVLDSSARHRGVSIPGHRHTALYDISLTETRVHNLLLEAGVELRFKHRVVDICKEQEGLNAVVVKRNRKETKRLTGDVFVDATGTAGSPRLCREHGEGCVMCVLRCPTFGPRVSPAALTGRQKYRERREEYVAISGSCKLARDSLGQKVKKQLKKKGIYVIRLDPELISFEKLASKACEQYTFSEFAQNLILLDTGDAKLMTPFFPLELLRSLEGFRGARYVDPCAGGEGNSTRFTEITPVEKTMRVSGLKNLYCAGEKAGLMVGHTEAIITGTLAGYNAAMKALGRKPLVLSMNTACGDFISYVHNEIGKGDCLEHKFTFSGSVYFDHMKNEGLYRTNREDIERRIEADGLKSIFSEGG